MGRGPDRPRCRRDPGRNRRSSGCSHRTLTDHAPPGYPEGSTPFKVGPSYHKRCLRSFKAVRWRKLDSEFPLRVPEMSPKLAQGWLGIASNKIAVLAQVVVPGLSCQPGDPGTPTTTPQRRAMLGDVAGREGPVAGGVSLELAGRGDRRRLGRRRRAGAPGARGGSTGGPRGSPT